MANPTSSRGLKRSRSIGEGGTPSGDDVESLQKKLKEVLATLKDESVAPEEARRRALGVAEEPVPKAKSVGTLFVDDLFVYGSAEVNRAFAICTFRNLSAEDEQQRKLAEANFKYGSVALAALASVWDVYQKHLEDKNVRVVKSDIHDAYYRKCVEQIPEEEQQQLHLAILTVVHVVVFKRTASAENLVNRYDAVMKSVMPRSMLKSCDSSAIIATLRRTWLRKIHDLLNQLDVPVLVLYGINRTNFYEEDGLRAVADHARWTASKGNTLYVEAIAKLHNAGCRLNFHPIIVAQYDAFMEALTALKTTYEEGWDLAISAGLPQTETVEPSKFPDLVYAACVYYKLLNVNVANWRIPAVVPTLSKAEVHRMIDDIRLSASEIETIARRKVEIFTESEVDDMMTKHDLNGNRDFTVGFVRKLVDLNKRELKKRVAASKDVHADDFLSRLPEDVKFLVLNRLPPKTLVTVAGVNKALRRFMHANACRLLNTPISTLVVSPSTFLYPPSKNAEPESLMWEFFIVSPDETLFGHRRTEPNPQGFACPTKDLGALSNILSVLPWLSFNERCDVVFRDVLDSKNRVPDSGLFKMPSLEDLARTQPPTDLATLARIVHEMKVKTISAWKEGKTKRPPPISLFFEKGIRGSTAELRTMFKLFANCGV
ncbi:hypothetical protein AAVH_33164, partial [Aphelenchoides avenae]